MKKHFQVSIYSSNSQMCSLTKEYFRNAGIDFYDYNVTKSRDAMADMEKKSGQTETPVVEIDGRIVCGYHPEVFDTIIKNEKNEKDKE